jgi:hypothetical protein
MRLTRPGAKTACVTLRSCVDRRSGAVRLPCERVRLSEPGFAYSGRVRRRQYSRPVYKTTNMYSGASSLFSADSSVDGQDEDPVDAVLPRHQHDGPSVLSSGRNDLGRDRPLASSSGEYAPGGLGFRSTANRVNVATSRAQCRVELVCSPRLLEADVKTVEQMQLVNALCRFVELASVADE